MKQQILYYDPKSQLTIAKLCTGFDQYLVVDNPQNNQDLINAGWANLIISAWDRPDQEFLLIIKNLTIDQYQLFSEMQPLLKRNLIGCSDSSVEIHNRVFYNQLVASGCDPHHFRLPPNLKIKAISTQPIKQKLWNDWKIEGWKDRYQKQIC